eukprot:TRINITY_DN17507_c0_g1_i1.p1 TRINITY_DN17507_c0_g1~~TRINITY_DN17507_c0_g1_i1.p1  ORF type:complete len:667 (+),score=106.21 TRINITY_DN17507_c0_g1_i1:106-2106(+)
MPPAELEKKTQYVQAEVSNPVDLLLSLIIRPPRSKYLLEKLGPKSFRVNGKAYGRRSDIILKNARGHALQCSLFEPTPGPGEVKEDHWSKLPCVIFLHGNSSCRLEALPLLPLLIPLRISLFCFDFSGSGTSDGEYISLGWFERDDLATCIAHLRSTGRVSSIALWGRSMGAFTALLHADRDPTIAGMVLDSPFVSLKLLAQELAGRKALIPSWATRTVLAAARSAIQSRADFDIEDLEAARHVDQTFMPALFVAARGDEFILPHHAERLFESYQGEKEFFLTEGDHHTARSEACRRKAVLFLCRAFHSERLDRLLELHDGGLVDIFGGPLSVKDTASAASPAGAGKREVDTEGSDIARQMRVIPVLSRIVLSRGWCCQRPMTVCTSLRLLEEVSEAGFFIRLEPAGGALAEVDIVGQSEDLGQPRFLVVTLTREASMVSRVHSDTLRTVAVGPGIPVGNAVNVTMSIDCAGTLSLHAGCDLLLTMDIGQTFRGELTFWTMLLRGQTGFANLVVEDGEATLREHLGDAMLRIRHLGHDDGVLLRSSRRFRFPGGDSGDLPSDLSLCTLGVHEVEGNAGVYLEDCASKPELLVGWRVKVSGLGEGVVTGVRTRFGRSTQHLISGLESPTATLTTESSTPCPVVLQLKQSRLIPWIRGHPFELVRKEF